MKKNLVLAASVLACASVALVSCGSETKKESGNGENLGNKIVSFEQAYDASVLSGIGLLNSDVTVSTPASYRLNLMADVKEEGNGETPNENPGTPDLKPSDKPNENLNGLDKLTDGLKGEILDNLAIANSTLNGNSTKSEVQKSDKPEWEQMYTITQKDMEGKDVVYTFYFTEYDDNANPTVEDKKVLLADGTTESDNVVDKPLVPEESQIPNQEVKPDANKDEEEVEKHIKGIVVVGENEYQVSGDREIEGNESSVEYKVMFDEKNYVKIESEVEGTENEYEYSKYVDGKRVFKSEVEYEINEDGEIEIEFETKTPENGKVKFSYEFVKNENNEDIIKVEVKKSEAGLKGEAIMKAVVNEAGESSYKFVSYNEEAMDSEK